MLKIIQLIASTVTCLLSVAGLWGDTLQMHAIAAITGAILSIMVYLGVGRIHAKSSLIEKAMMWVVVLMCTSGSTYTGVLFMNSGALKTVTDYNKKVTDTYQRDLDQYKKSVEVERKEAKEEWDNKKNSLESDIKNLKYKRVKLERKYNKGKPSRSTKAQIDQVNSELNKKENIALSMLKKFSYSSDLVEPVQPELKKVNYQLSAIFVPALIDFFVFFIGYIRGKVEADAETENESQNAVESGSKKAVSKEIKPDSLPDSKNKKILIEQELNLDSVINIIVTQTADFEEVIKPGELAKKLGVSHQKLGRLLKTNGFEIVRPRVNGKQVRGYLKSDFLKPRLSVVAGV